MKSLPYVILCLLSDHSENRAPQAAQSAASASAEGKSPLHGVQKAPHLHGAIKTLSFYSKFTSVSVGTIFTYVLPTPNTISDPSSKVYTNGLS